MFSAAPQCFFFFFFFVVVVVVVVVVPFQGLHGEFGVLNMKPKRRFFEPRTFVFKDDGALIVQVLVAMDNAPAQLCTKK